MKVGHPGPCTRNPVNCWRRSQQHSNSGNPGRRREGKHLAGLGTYGPNAPESGLRQILAGFRQRLEIFRIASCLTAFFAGLSLVPATCPRQSLALQKIRAKLLRQSLPPPSARCLLALLFVQPTRHRSRSQVPRQQGLPSIPQGKRVHLRQQPCGRRRPRKSGRA